MSPASPYADLEIRLLERGSEGYPVEMTLDGQQEFPRGMLDPATLPLPWVPSAGPAADGERLFRWLTADPRLTTAWAETRGRQPQRRIRLRIDASAPELHVIPWELLREPDLTGPSEPVRSTSLPLAASDATPFSRYLAGQWQPGSPILQRPIRVLVAIANPENLADYGLQAVESDTEWAALRTALTGLEVQLTRFPPALAGNPAESGPETVSPRTAVPCTLAALEDELRKGYHVLHFIGHGAYSDKSKSAVLYMADEQDRVQLVRDADLAGMLARGLTNTAQHADDKLRLVFLASCQTATRSPADAFRGLAPQLVAAGVPAVVAMQDLVPVETARRFATTFYRQLLAHGQADLAANEARSGLLSAGLPGAAIPVLFMRLRSGELLGQRGRISSERGESFWPFLIRNIARGQCAAFLGPRVNAGLLPSPEAVAEQLAAEYDYPMPNRGDLARVAQFIALSDPDLLRDDYLRILQRGLIAGLGLHPAGDERCRLEMMGFAESARALNWSEQVLAVRENALHHRLAELPFPLYITTNADNFMVEALRHEKLDARQIGLRWRRAEAGTPQFVLSPPPGPTSPVVVHLNGYDGDPEQAEHLVLSEDDYLSHIVRLSRDRETILPMDVLGLLSQSSFMFLGYGLDDWEFRVLLQGLIGPLAQTNPGRKMHVGVQLEPAGAPSAKRAMDYLQRYLGQFRIEVYWGTPQQFVDELHAAWEEYRSGGA
jgi:hypothetical protein